MVAFNWQVMAPALPEMFVGLMSMVLLMCGVFTRGEVVARVAMLSRWTLLGALLLLIAVWQGQTLFAFPRLVSGADMFILDEYALVMKGAVLVFAMLALYLPGDFLARHKIQRFEYYILHLLCVLGMMLMISAHDLLVLYMGMELMSFTLYILAAFMRDNAKSSEAGLKYFVLGSLASGLMLYGISLFYGLSGTTEFYGVQAALSGGMVSEAHQLTLSIALVMFLTGMAFKISAAPFHMWTPDVYEGAPTPVTAFMAVVPKLAAFALLMRVLYEPLVYLIHEWQQIFMVISLMTMAVGAYMAIMQENIKRLLAYSSIGHVGFMLVGLTAGGVSSVEAVIVYLLVYGAMTLGTFAVLISLRHREEYIETISDMKGLFGKEPVLATAMLILMLSLAGVPPLAGFMAKWYVFMAAVEAGYTWLAVAGVLFSVVAAYYSLKVVRVMFFEDGGKKVSSDVPVQLRAIVTLSTLFVVSMFIFTGKLAGVAHDAAQSLLMMVP